METLCKAPFYSVMADECMTQQELKNFLYFFVELKMMNLFGPVKKLMLNLYKYRE